MVTSAFDILSALNWEVKPAQQLKMDFSKYSKDEKLVLSSIEIEAKGFDAISTETKINFNDLLVCLTKLELDGLVKQIEGEKYKLS